MFIMNTYLQNNISLKESDIVETSLLLYGKIDNFTIGKSKIIQTSKWTFLLDGKDYFANGCKYTNINDCMNYILDNHKQQIREGLKPYLKVNNNIVETYILIQNL